VLCNLSVPPHVCHVEDCNRQCLFTVLAARRRVITMDGARG
jgi:hypothetical protein